MNLILLEEQMRQVIDSNFTKKNIMRRLINGARLIAHRGNISGPSDKENTVSHIFKALNLGYDAEIDVWKDGNFIYLGHNTPDNLINPSFLEVPNLWCHANNLEALDYLLDKKIHCFWHEDDNFTITSRGYIWNHVMHKDAVEFILARSVYLNFDIPSKIPNCHAICSDYVQMIDVMHNSEWDIT